MWLASFLSQSKGQSRTSTGSVVASAGGIVDVDTALRHRNLPVVAPYGVVYVPPVGEDAVVMSTLSGEACVGVVAPRAKDLLPGELMLCSAGGASIVLKNDGTVLINGVAAGGD
ncbi:MAG: hypothetical protein IJV88_02015 [Ruminococcus sp.]|nr:hypothetical protein [Ruminococcus sp.]